MYVNPTETCSRCYVDQIDTIKCKNQVTFPESEFLISSSHTKRAVEQLSLSFLSLFLDNLFT